MRTITKEDQARAVVMIFHEMRDAVLSRLDAMPPDFDATDLHILVRFVTDSMLIPEKEVSVERRELLFHFFMKNSLDAKKPLPDAVVGHVEQFLCGDNISVRYGGEALASRSRKNSPLVCTKRSSSPTRTTRRRPHTPPATTEDQEPEENHPVILNPLPTVARRLTV